MDEVKDGRGRSIQPGELIELRYNKWVFSFNPTCFENERGRPVKYFKRGEKCIVTARHFSNVYGRMVKFVVPGELGEFETETCNIKRVKE
jgi:hypothetical protein